MKKSDGYPNFWWNFRNRSCIFKTFTEFSKYFVTIQILLQIICEAGSHEQFSSEIKDRSTLNYQDFMMIKKFPGQRIMNTGTERSLGCRRPNGKN